MFSPDSNMLFLTSDSWMLVLSRLTYSPKWKPGVFGFYITRWKYMPEYCNGLTIEYKWQHCMELTRHRPKIIKIQRWQMTITVYVSII